MRKIAIATVALLTATGAASAQSPRPDLYTMTCASAAAVVTQRGAVVGNTGPNTYERIVSSAGFCQKGEQAVPYFSRSRDQAQCMVGFECRDITLWDTK